MTILHFSTSVEGGAGIAAKRTHKAMLDAGMQSALIVLKGGEVDEGVYSLYPKKNKFPGLITFIKRKFKNLLFKEEYSMYSLFDYTFFNPIKLIDSLGIKPKIIVLHWVADFITLDMISKLKKRYGCEIYWNLMDMAAFTGGCHFSWDCRQYQEACNKCPASKFNLLSSWSNKYFLRKKEIIEKLRIKCIASTKWVESQVQTSEIKFFEIYQCYIPTDESTFFPKASLEKEDRDLGNLKIFFGSQNLADKRKGSKYFLDSINILKNLLDNENISTEKINIVLPGVKSENKFSNIPFKVLYVPYAQNEAELNKLYNYVDIFVCPSVEDTGPQMVSESLMSGTPVIAFEMGIAPELFRNCNAVITVPLYDTKAMADKLLLYLKLEAFQRVEASVRARNIALQTFSNKACVKKFKSIFKTVDN